MSELYAEAVAFHYAAYRPPLHEHILGRVLADSKSFSDGLDVGCGTGRSAIALAAFCERVLAIDPSESMLNAAEGHASVTYLQGSAEHIPLPNHSVDIVTFAGSLSYARVDATVAELKRVCRADALVVPYDFMVSIEKELNHFEIAVKTDDSDYDHQAGFSGVSGLTQVLKSRERIRFEVEPEDFAHVLLADQARHDAFVSRYGTALPHKDLSKELGSCTNSRMLEADIFYSLYRIADGSTKRPRP